MKLPLVTRNTVATLEGEGVAGACMGPHFGRGRAWMGTEILMYCFWLADGGLDARSGTGCRRGDGIESAALDVGLRGGRRQEAQQFARRLGMAGADRHASRKTGDALHAFRQAA